MPLRDLYLLEVLSLAVDQYSIFPVDDIVWAVFPDWLLALCRPLLIFMVFLIRLTICHSPCWNHEKYQEMALMLPVSDLNLLKWEPLEPVDQYFSCPVDENLLMSLLDWQCFLWSPLLRVKVFFASIAIICAFPSSSLSWSCTSP